MKNLGIILLTYNLLCLSVLTTDWYRSYWKVLDALDTIFYLVAIFVFFGHYSKLNRLQRDGFIFSAIYLAFKALDNYQHFSYATFMFWNLFIILFPLFKLGVRMYNNIK